MKQLLSDVGKQYRNVTPEGRRSYNGQLSAWKQFLDCKVGRGNSNRSQGLNDLRSQT